MTATRFGSWRFSRGSRAGCWPPTRRRWERDKVILMSFPDEASWRDWALSPAHHEISRDRHAGSDGVVPLLKGLGAPPAGT